MVGDGSYLMMLRRSSTAVQEGLKLTIVAARQPRLRVASAGCRGRLGADGFGTLFRVSGSQRRTARRRAAAPIDLAANAASRWARRCCVREIAAELRAALEAAKASERTDGDRRAEVDPGGGRAAATSRGGTCRSPRCPRATVFGPPAGTTRPPARPRGATCRPGAVERSRRLASAPVTWGVWERTTGRDDLVPPGLLLRTVAGLGYPGIELGPPGYLELQALADAWPRARRRLCAAPPRRRGGVPGRSPRLARPGRSGARRNGKAGAGRPCGRGHTRAARGRRQAGRAGAHGSRGRRHGDRARARLSGGRALSRTRRRCRLPPSHRDLCRDAGGDRGVRRADGRAALLRHRARRGRRRRSRRTCTHVCESHRPPAPEGRGSRAARPRAGRGDLTGAGVGRRHLLSVRRGHGRPTRRPGVAARVSTAGSCSNRTGSPCARATSRPSAPSRRRTCSTCERRLGA